MNISLIWSGWSGVSYAALAVATISGLAWLARWMHGRRDLQGPVFTRRAAYLFLLFLLVVVVAADAGALPRQLRVLYDYPNGDRLGHGVMFGILAFLFSATFRGFLRVGHRAIPVVVVALLAFATLEEVSQQWFPLRHFDPVDLLCSYAGIALGGWAGARWRRRAGSEERLSRAGPSSLN